MRPIALISLACRYPDAPTPEALWSNVIDGRRSFRPLPPERLDLSRYAAEVVGEPDSITKIKAGLLTQWQFDHSRYRIPYATYTATDLTHWLALETAHKAIANAGGIDVLDRDRTAVIVANTLTGEFSRSALLRLRGPFIDALIAESAEEVGIGSHAARGLRERVIARLRERFPEPQEDTLAGGLANTIAGRIANYFDLHGGAYSVDAACASSLVALADAANLLSLGEIDAAVVGAVDVSIDPFELVGFSRNGALARDDMRVFDARSSGFWPGEGVGFVLLMREKDAHRRGLPVKAILRGWGISSDGAGGFTRPDARGQLRALQRAYVGANVDPTDVGYVEAHGTGTEVGDPVEVSALAAIREGAERPLPIGSIKANIGHTKAAAGLAGLIKVVAAVETGVIPPHVSCEIPHRVFGETGGRVRPALIPESWPDGKSRLAGVSGFGFGGINAHIVVEKRGRARPRPSIPAAPLLQDAELFVFAAETASDLREQLAALQRRARTMSVSELGDAAIVSTRSVQAGSVRVALVARNVEELESHLALACEALSARREIFEPDRSIFVAFGPTPPRIGFLFPGQAAPSRPDGGLWSRRFELTRELLCSIPHGGDHTETSVAQPAVAAGSLAALRILRACGIAAVGAVGHSLGELCALAWAESIAEELLVPLAATRGALVSAHAASGGAMLRLAASAAAVQTLIGELDATIACDNGPTEIVASGPQPAIRALQSRASNAGFETTPLRVSHAFHSRAMATTVSPFTQALHGLPLKQVAKPVYSTVTGERLCATEDVAGLLTRQLVSPVRFAEALKELAAATDLLIEVGPGAGLSRLARGQGLRVVATDAYSTSLIPLLTTLAACFALGSPVGFAPLLQGRRARDFDVDTRPQFIANPCGSTESGDRVTVPLEQPHAAEVLSENPLPSSEPLDVIRGLLAAETRLRQVDIDGDHRFLDDLHLNSLSVARIVVRAAAALGIAPPRRPTDFANATSKELAAALAELREFTPECAADSYIPGVARWLRTYGLRWRERPTPSRKSTVRWRTVVIADGAASSPSDDSQEGDGLLIWLDREFRLQDAVRLYLICQQAWRDTHVRHLAFCHVGAPVSAFARSLAAERRFVSVRVLERRPGFPAAQVDEEIAREIIGFSEVLIDGNGRYEPEFVPVEPRRMPGPAIGNSDVVLVTGGGKGIGAECALRLAERTGAALILLGRSGADDPKVVATVQRASQLNLRCRYVCADAALTAHLGSEIDNAVRELGAVTVLVHAAGVNQAARFQAVSLEEFNRTIAPKVTGLRAAIDACGASLRRVVAFGSVIGRFGLEGEAHYALANAWQTEICNQLAAERPDVQVLSLEWSVWSGVGMGEPRATVSRLADLGVDALPIEDALNCFERLVLGGAVGTIAATGRFGPPPNLTIGAAQLPILRFVDAPRIHFPGVELIVETELSQGRDIYLRDHQIGSLYIWPGVFALEAMAQVASALHGGEPAGEIEDVQFREALTVVDGKSLRIRIAALAEADGRVAVAIRAADDGFATDRAVAVFHFGTKQAPSYSPPVAAGEHFNAQALYGTLFFQGHRFCRVADYQLASSRHIVASLKPEDHSAWFSEYDPSELVLGDPGSRDAMLHCLQAAIPHKRVVPVSAERIAIRRGSAARRVEARERYATDNSFTFDIDAYDDDGRRVEEWRGVTFRALEPIDVTRVLASAPQLTAAYLERIVRAELADQSVEVALVSSPVLSRSERRALAVSNLGLERRLARRGDGKPILIDGESGAGVSLAHAGNHTLAVYAAGDVGCDLEMLAEVQGPSGGRDRAEEEIRLWTVTEATLKSDGLPELNVGAPRASRSGPVTFETPDGRATTVRIPTFDGDLIVAISIRSQRQGLRKKPPDGRETAVTQAAVS